MRDRSRSRLLAAAAAIALFFQSEVQGAELEEVVVVAQRRAENLQDIPVAVTALSGEAIRDKGIESSADLQFAIPALVFNDNSRFAQPYIRGIGTDIASPGAEASVATFIDGVYQTQLLGGSIPLYGIDRVEVLKGPQGTLFGRNATGGAITFYTKNPSDRFEANFSAGLGNEGARSLDGYLSVPFSDNVRFNTFASVRARDGFGKNVASSLDSPTAGVDAWDENYYAIRTKLLIDVAETTDVLISGSYYRSDDSKTGYITPDEWGSLHIGTTLVGQLNGPAIISKYSHDLTAWYPNRTDFENWSIAAEVNHAFGNINFKSISAYQEFQADSSVDYDATAAPIFTFTAAHGQGRGNGQVGETLSQEFQVHGETGNASWLIGAFYIKDDSGFNSLNVLVGPTLAFFVDTQIETEAYALFAHSTMNLNEKTDFTLGIRYSDEKKTQAKLFHSLLNADLAAGDISSDDFTYKLALGYQISDDVKAYAKYESGFKSGVINTLTPVGTPGSTVDPEKVDSYELGLKSEWFDNRLRVNAALFYYDYQNLQQQFVDTSTGSTLYEAAEEARIFGLDADFELVLTEGLSVTGGISLLDTEYKKFNSTGALVPNTQIIGPGIPGNTAVTDLDVSGNDVVRAPDMTFNLGVDWNVPVMQVGDLTASLSYFYSDSYFFDATNRLTQDSYQILNATLRYRPRGGSWTMEVWGKNILDEKYYQIVVASAMGDLASPGSPATYGLRIGYEF
jgi:iron complex outermembrane recepter protein